MGGDAGVVEAIRGGVRVVEPGRLLGGGREGIEEEKLNFVGLWPI